MFFQLCLDDTILSDSDDPFTDPTYDPPPRRLPSQKYDYSGIIKILKRDDTSYEKGQEWLVACAKLFKEGVGENTFWLSLMSSHTMNHRIKINQK